MEKTLQNLAKAFVGESQARNRYTFYSKVAKKEGYEQISEIFLLTAENEREHAKWLFKMIQELKAKNFQEKTLEVEAEVPTDYGDTEENLQVAIAGEHYENSQMYPEFAQTAEEEGLPEIAQRLKAIGRAEVHHEDRYTCLLQEVQGKTIFKKSEKKEWVCRKCGYVHEGEEAPAKCPSCDHPYNYFELKCETY